MCGACGVLGGGPDWVDRVGNPDGVGHAEALTSGAERQRRIRLVNLLLRDSRANLVDFGTMMVLRGATGQTEIVDSLMHVWAAVDRVTARPIDPLDERLLLQLGKG